VDLPHRPVENPSRHPDRSTEQQALVTAIDTDIDTVSHTSVTPVTHTRVPTSRDEYTVQSCSPPQHIALVQVRIISELPSTHYGDLNERYNFFSISPERCLRHPPPSIHGYPIYFKDDLRTCLAHYCFWNKDGLIHIAERHEIELPNVSASRLPASHYLKLLLNHTCNAVCKNLVFCFKPIGRNRTLQRIASHERDHQTQTRPHLSHDQNAIRVYITPSVYLRNMIIKEWQDLFSTQNQRWAVCAICSRRFCNVTLDRVPVHTIDFTLLQNPSIPRQLMPTTYNTAEYQGAILNAKGLSDITRRHGLITLCKECHKSMKDGEMPKFALANWLYYARDRLPVSARRAFRDATIFERNLICRARATRITLRYCHNPSSPHYGRNFETSQGYSMGNVMVLPQDTISLQSVLPPPPETVRDTMAVLFIGPTAIPTHDNIKKLRPCLVRKSRVRKLIDFLIKHNPYYRPSPDFHGLSSQNLDALYAEGDNDFGEDGSLMPSVEIEHIDSRRRGTLPDVTSDYTNRNVPDINDLDLSNRGDLLLENVGYTLGDTSTASFNLMKIRAFEHCNSGGSFVQSRHGSTPMPDFDNPSLLSWLFPHLDPWGIGGFHHPGRKKAITMEEQLRYLISLDDPSFATDPTFAFVYFNISQKKTIVRDCFFRVRQNQYSQTIEELQNVPLDVLQRLERKYMRNPGYQPGEIVEQRLVHLLSRLQCINYKLPGSKGYKKHLRNEIWGLVYRYGTPALFVTINPSDVNHPLVRLIVGENIDLEDAARGEDMSKFYRHKLAADNPHATAIFFDRVIRAFIHIILRYGRGDPGLFGLCTAYYGTVEAQGKGTLHCHFLIWLDGHLSPQKMHEQLQSDEAFKENLFEYLESIIKNELPGMREPLKEDAGAAVLPPARDTMLPNPSVTALPRYTGDNDSDFERRFQETVFQLVIENHWHQHNATCWKYLKHDEPQDDAHCRLGIDGSIEPFTHIDPGTGNVVLRRLHPRINSYNPVLTFLTQSNNDIKFIGSGEDAKALVYYVTDYITKSALPTHVGLSSLRIAIDRNQQKFSNGDMNPDPMQVSRSLFVKCANSILGRQEISHPQVMSYLVGSGDVYKSHVFQPLMWTVFDRVVGQSFAHDQVDSYDAGSQYAYPGHNTDPDVGEDLDGKITIQVGVHGVTHNSLYEDYVYRPDVEPFNSLSLYDFVRRTRKSTVHKSSRQISRDRDESRGRPRTSRGTFLVGHSQAGRYCLMLRIKDVVPVLIGPSLMNPAKGEAAKEQWCRAMLILFKSWRAPFDLKDGSATWTVAYEAMVFDSFQASVIRNMAVLCECRDKHDQHMSTRGRQHLARAWNDSANLDMQLECETPSLAVDEALSMVAVNDAEICDSDSFRMEKRPRPSRILTSLFTVQPQVPTLADKSRFVLGSEEESIIKAHASLMRSLKNSGKPLARNEEDTTSAHLSSMTGAVHENTDVSILQERSSGARMIPTQNRVLPVDAVAQVISEFNLDSNSEQMRAFQIITDHLRDQDDQLLMYIGGVGGTGKSHVIKSIVRYFDIMKQREQLILAAPTGAAAIIIGGATLHSITLPFTENIDIEALTNLWQHVRLLIIDEVSMIGASLLSAVSRRLNQARNRSSDGLQFGGINVVFFGDFGQLRPVGDTALFHHEILGKISSHRTVNSETGQLAMQGANAWHQVDTVVLLKQNKRQSSDPLYAALLDRVRCGQAHTRGEVDISGKSDVDILRSRLLSNVIEFDPELGEKLLQYPIITATKADRDDLNNWMLRTAAQRFGQEVHVYHSIDRMHRAPLPHEWQGYVWRLDSTATEDSLGLLPLFSGMKVMLTENVAIGSRLVNGAEGVVHSVLYDVDDSNRRFAKVCYVHFPGCSINLDGFPPDIAPVIPTSSSFDDKKQHRINRTQLPLLPGYCYTDYKSQGRSLDCAIVDLHRTKSLQGAYVMLSRVRSLDGLIILRDFDDKVIEQELTSDLRKELTRLDRMNEYTLKKHEMHRSESYMTWLSPQH
jgi:Helitron helicase-like domain at N-terminus/PIF1-like helicase